MTKPRIYRTFNRTKGIFEWTVCEPYVKTMVGSQLNCPRAHLFRAWDFARTMNAKQ